MTALNFDSKNDWSDIDKMFFLVIKMNESKGYNNIKIKLGKPSYSYNINVLEIFQRTQLDFY